jgi:hypothetical protein
MESLLGEPNRLQGWAGLAGLNPGNQESVGTGCSAVIDPDQPGGWADWFCEANCFKTIRSLGTPRSRPSLIVATRLMVSCTRVSPAGRPFDSTGSGFRRRTIRQSNPGLVIRWDVRFPSCRSTGNLVLGLLKNSVPRMRLTESLRYRI